MTHSISILLQFKLNSHHYNWAFDNNNFRVNHLQKANLTPLLVLNVRATQDRMQMI